MPQKQHCASYTRSPSLAWWFPVSASPKSATVKKYSYTETTTLGKVEPHREALQDVDRERPRSTVGTRHAIVKAIVEVDLLALWAQLIACESDSNCPAKSFANS